ncbi:MAG: cryptochrome/photolyase family protein [Burkholderiaceae bacterium]
MSRWPRATRSLPRPRLGLVLGDQLAHRPGVLQGEANDFPLLMIEAPGESTHVPSHKARTTLFLSAMRHAAQAWRDQGLTIEYVRLQDPDYQSEPTLGGRLALWLARNPSATLWCVETGDLRLTQDIERACASQGVHLQWRQDPHFLISRAAFSEWANDRKQLRMEHFYRFMRRRHAVLITPEGDPEGGQWNFDAENRQSFGKQGPVGLPTPVHFQHDDITRAVMQEVEQVFASNPGSLSQFGWPVTRAHAIQALDDFIAHRLYAFGPHQDAMWTGMQFGWHALLSSSLNLHLIEPREVIDRVLQAYQEGRADLPSVEGFIRQVLGWREFMRGVYWLEMPGLAQANGLAAQRPLPAWFWTGKTHMACQAQVIEQTLAVGYAHHIQRLMVTGLFGLLAEIRPQALSDWFHAVYVDAVDWVERPNVVGMALYANAGRFTSKPYLASGAYIDKMSNYCRGCRYDPKQRTGPNACPMTSLYWRFVLGRHALLKGNPRTSLMAKQGDRLSQPEKDAILSWTDVLLERLEEI